MLPCSAIARLVSLAMVVCCVTAGFSSPGFANGQIELPSPSSSGFKGASVAMDGDAIVVGAPDSSTVHVYTLDRYLGELLEAAVIVPRSLQASQQFGVSVAIKGDLIVVGARFHSTLASTDTGHAIVHRYHPEDASWTLVENLYQPSELSNAYFGTSVAISRTGVVVVGAPGVDSLDGAVYVFRPSATEADEWLSSQSLHPVGPGSSGSKFGSTVAISDDASIIIVGAYDYQPAGNAFVFLYSDTEDLWVLADQLVPSDLIGGSFGASVAVAQSGQLLVGLLYSTPSPPVGAAFVFDRVDGKVWNHTATLGPSSGVGSDYVGSSVALSDGIAVVGAHGSDFGQDNSGAIHVYRWDAIGTSWTNAGTFQAPFVQQDGSYGHSVATTGSFVVVGAPGEDSSSGSGYVLSAFSCQEDFRPNADNSDCDVCPAGTNSILGLPCSCPDGSVIDAADAVCIACPAEARAAPPGSVGIAECVCPAGTYNDGVAACVTCPAGTDHAASPEGASSEEHCVACAAGSTSTAADGVCTPCAFPFTSQAGDTACSRVSAAGIVVAALTLVGTVAAGVLVARSRRQPAQEDAARIEPVFSVYSKAPVAGVATTAPRAKPVAGSRGRGRRGKSRGASRKQRVDTVPIAQMMDPRASINTHHTVTSEMSPHLPDLE